MKNLLIVFPGGCGGNHLANLISLNNKFTPRFKSNNYHQELLNHYKENSKTSLIKDNGKLYDNPNGIKAHFAEHHHLDQLYSSETLQELINTQTINILIGHEHDFEQAEFQDKLISKIPDPFWIVMTYPNENTLAHNRIKLYNFTPRPERYTYPFYVSSFNFNPDFPKADNSNSILIQTENFIAKSGCDYIRTELKKIDIELPDIALDIHDIWYNKLVEILTLYNALPT